MKFTYNIGEKVFIKGNWKTVYTVIKRNNLCYKLQTEDKFNISTWYNDNQLTNSRKSEFLNFFRKSSTKTGQLDKEVEKKEVENVKKEVEKKEVENVKKEVYKYINWDAKNRPSKVLFTGKDSPKLVFYWSEEDYSGSIFSIYEYNYDNKLYYLCLSSSFGSCSGCDDWENVLEKGWCGEDNTQEKRDYILKEFNNVYVETNKENILLNKKYIHPQLRTKLILEKF